MNLKNSVELLQHRDQRPSSIIAGIVCGFLNFSQAIGVHRNRYHTKALELYSGYEIQR